MNAIMFIFIRMFTKWEKEDRATTNKKRKELEAKTTHRHKNINESTANTYLYISPLFPSILCKCVRVQKKKTQQTNHFFVYSLYKYTIVCELNIS